MGLEEAVRRCERRDRITEHVIESIGSDNRVVMQFGEVARASRP